MSIPAPAALPRRVVLGIEVRPVHEETCRARALVPCSGLEVTHVDVGSAAEAAGLLERDVLVRVDGRSPPSFEMARHDTSTQRVLKVEVVREAKTLSLSITPATAPIEAIDPSLGVSLEVGDVSISGARLRTLTTLPASHVQAPAVLILQGYDCGSIDDAGVFSAYRELALAWTSRGAIVMRVEKEGVGDSTGTPCADGSLAREIDGFRGALHALQTHPRVDASRVVLFGHSMGAFVAPLVLRGTSVAGVAVVGTTGKAWPRSFADAAARSLDPNVSSDPFSYTTSGRLFGRSPGYFREVAAITPDALWPDVHAPVLIVHGVADTVVDIDDATTLRTIIEGASTRSRAGQAVDAKPPTRVSFLTINGVQHGLVNAAGHTEPALIDAFWRWMTSLPASR